MMYNMNIKIYQLWEYENYDNKIKYIIILNILHSIGMIQIINFEIYNYFLKYYYIKNYNGRSIIFNLVIYIINYNYNI